MNYYFTEEEVINTIQSLQFYSTKKIKSKIQQCMKNITLNSYIIKDESNIYFHSSVIEQIISMINQGFACL